MAITNVGIIENDFGHLLTVSPNPTNGNVNVLLGSEYRSVKITIMDIKGKLIQSEEFNMVSSFDFYLEGKPGYYLLRISSPTKHALIKVLKE